MNVVKHHYENISFKINLAEGILAEGIPAGGTFNTPDIISLWHFCRGILLHSHHFPHSRSTAPALPIVSGGVLL